MRTVPDTNAQREGLPVRGALILFGVALAIRIAAIVVLDSPHDITRGTWDWGFEPGCIARSMFEGHGFAGPWTRAESPWDLGSGPTAWLSPAYPALIAQLMALCGGLVPATALALLVVQSIVSAATCVVVWMLGSAWRVGRVGQWSAWAFALYPASIWNAAHTVWDTTIVAFGLVCLVWAVFAFARARPLVWAAIGLGTGALVLVNPAPLVIVPIAVYAAWRAREHTALFASRVLAFVIVAFLVLLPWMLRNQRVLGSFALRTNLGVELAVGNNDEANGRFQLSRHPSNSPEQFAIYRAMGEVPYAARAMREARAWIGEHPGRFAALCARRVLFFWLGEDPLTDPRVDDAGRRALTDPKSWIKFLSYALVGVLGLVGAIAWARRGFEGRFLLGVCVLFPIAYYGTHVLERYRFPIEPFLVLAAVGFVHDLWASRRSRSLSSGA